jgi:hypothetical protein
MTTQELEKRIEKLEKRISTLEDIEAIQKFHLQYIAFYNNHQYKEMASCFAEDATIDTQVFKPRRGKKEILDLCLNDLPTVNNWATAHVVVQPIITVDGDRARGLWTMYLYFFDVPTPKGPSARMAQALHDCEYVKVNGEWKFSSVKFSVPWPKQLQCMPPR